MFGNEGRMFAGLINNDTLVLLVFFLLLFQAGIIVLLVSNISRRKKAEEASSSSEKQLRHMIEYSPVGICIISERRFSYVNPAYVKMFGFDSDQEILGRPVEELYAPAERARQRRFSRERAAGKPVPTSYETVGLRKDGTTFDVTAWVSLIEHNDVPSSLGFVVDNSVERQLRRQLEQANRLEAIGNLAGGIAHDFNNILTAIIGYSELAYRMTEKDQEVHDNLSQVLKASARAKELVQQILAFSRDQKKKMSAVQLSHVVQEVLNLIRATVPATIEINTELDSNKYIYGDPTQIHQLLMNLCTNAEYAMRGEGGKLLISLKDYVEDMAISSLYPGLRAGPYICLSVSDTGNGIPVEIKDRIFEPFFTTKDVGDGTGMGLAQVHGIVAEHRGHIAVAENLPKGTTFNILFPQVEPDKEISEDTQRDIPGGTETILVVDDEEMVLQVICRRLSDLGYTVIPAVDSEDALHKMSAGPDDFDLVISDVAMPNMSGNEMAAKMLQMNPDLPIVLCTGYSSSIDEAKARQIGVKAFLEKPVSREKLAITIREILDYPE